MELHKAVSSDDIKKVQELIADGVNVNSTNKAGLSPLDLVSQVIITKDKFSIFKVNALEIATALIKAGAEVSKTSKLHSQLLVHVISIQRVVYAPEASGFALALIEAGADVNARDNSERSALHRAFASFGDYSRIHMEVALALIKAGADVNSRDKKGRTPLFLASTIHLMNIEAIVALIEAGADVNARDYKGQTPLFQTSKETYSTLELINAGADVNVTDKEGNTPLSKALQGDDFHAVHVAIFLIAAGADIHNEAVLKALQQHFLLKGYRSRTGNLLHVFSQYGFVEAVKVCINAGYDVNARYKEDPAGRFIRYGPTPLQSLIEDPNEQIVLLTKYDKFPLLQKLYDLKETKSHEEVISILIEAGADVNLSNKPDDTPLVLAIKSGYISFALMLMEAGARLNWDSYGSPLNAAIKHKNIPFALTLIEAGAEIKKLLVDINDEVDEGGTLLHYAADGNFIEATRALIEAGANVSVKNSDGDIPYCLAYKKDYVEVAEVIRPEGFGKTFQWFKCL